MKIKTVEVVKLGRSDSLTGPACQCRCFVVVLRGHISQEQDDVSDRKRRAFPADPGYLEGALCAMSLSSLLHHEPAAERVKESQSGSTSEEEAAGSAKRRVQKAAERRNSAGSLVPPKVFPHL